MYGIISNINDGQTVKLFWIENCEFLLQHHPLFSLVAIVLASSYVRRVGPAEMVDGCWFIYQRKQWTGLSLLLVRSMSVPTTIIIITATIIITRHTSSVHPIPCFYLSTLWCGWEGRRRQPCSPRIREQCLEDSNLWGIGCDGKCLCLIPLCQIYGNALFGCRIILAVVVVNRSHSLTDSLNNSQAFRIGLSLRPCCHHHHHHQFRQTFSEAK